MCRERSQLLQRTSFPSMRFCTSDLTDFHHHHASLVGMNGLHCSNAQYNVYLEGSLPTSFPFVNPLTRVWLANTSIWGTIPTAASANTALQYMYVSSNVFLIYIWSLCGHIIATWMALSSEDAGHSLKRWSIGVTFINAIISISSHH